MPLCEGALPVPLAAATLREGLVLILTDAEGRTGIGEIAPLAGLHTETLDTAQWQVCAWIKGELHHPVLPSVQCGLEMALWSLENQPYSRVYHRLQPVNALLVGNRDTILRSTEEAVRSGYTTFKLKVGRSSLEEDVARVHAIRQYIGKTMTLRLDANRSWSLETALRFGEQVSSASIEYIEEPLRNLDDVPLFVERTGIKVALDETLYSQHRAERLYRLQLPKDVLAAYVLKPACLGGMKVASALAAEAITRNLLPVLSSVFETGIALSFYAALQSSWMPNTAIPCGLDTYKFLLSDLLISPFDVQQGAVDVETSWQNRMHLRYDMMKRIV
ncbi:MAG: o-succinylbenzoate synthase [Bacteroidota bacterium]|nr:o-succinylbenzoate synthase [Candidatus Kapabacteria bacterium]MDW8220370.1 o-succinylbenzoate synthase [Bacteroidota bacterium]